MSDQPIQLRIDLLAGSGSVSLSTEISSPAEVSPPPRTAPWRGRKRAVQARDRFVAVRCTDVEFETISAAAQRAGLSVGAFLRTLGCGSAGPRAVRKAPVEIEALSRLLGQIGRLGSKVNELEQAAQASGGGHQADQLGKIGDEVRDMRTAVMKALGRGD